jgi:hypothetical protein
LRATEIKEGHTRFDFGNAMLLFWESMPAIKEKTIISPIPA